MVIGGRPRVAVMGRHGRDEIAVEIAVAKQGWQPPRSAVCFSEVSCHWQRCWPLPGAWCCQRGKPTAPLAQMPVFGEPPAPAVLASLFGYAVFCWVACLFCDFHGICAFDAELARCWFFKCIMPAMYACLKFVSFFYGGNEGILCFRGPPWAADFRPRT